MLLVLVLVLVLVLLGEPLRCSSPPPRRRAAGWRPPARGRRWWRGGRPGRLVRRSLRRGARLQRGHRGAEDDVARRAARVRPEHALQLVVVGGRRAGSGSGWRAAGASATRAAGAMPCAGRARCAERLAELSGTELRHAAPQRLAAAAARRPSQLPPRTSAPLQACRGPTSRRPTGKERAARWGGGAVVPCRSPIAAARALVLRRRGRSLPGAFAPERGSFPIELPYALLIPCHPSGGRFGRARRHEVCTCPLARVVRYAGVASHDLLLAAEKIPKLLRVHELGASLAGVGRRHRQRQPRRRRAETKTPCWRAMRALPANDTRRLMTRESSLGRDSSGRHSRRQSVR